jgi:NADH dehydrogenase [ubiquinone] 1 alpha subcomplex assembly factor 7
MADPTQLTPLTALLLDRIAAQGPLGLHDYMAECLLHPTHGYYTTRAPFGAKGDFITAPEISQMFGELLGLCLADAWMAQGSPPLFTLAELGPGRGTLMADVLRATKRVAGFHSAMRLHLIEASPRLRALQKQALAGYDVIWDDEIAALPQAPLFLLANEFFDALPIRQFRREGDMWCETLIGAKDGQLVFGKSAPFALERTDTKSGDILEICPSADGIMSQISQRICEFGGAGLIIDYGGWNGLGDTFQAMQAHHYVDPLDSPGLADLTAHVDFAALSRNATPCVCAYTTQGAFLSRLGIAGRATVLAKSLTGSALYAHLQATERLTAPAEMGELFKVLGLRPAGTPPLAGFDLDSPC